MNKRIPLVDEAKLFAVIGKFFTDGNNLLLELIQNAQRAQARSVKIELPYKGEHKFNHEPQPGYILRISDDGRGIKDIVALLGIAMSDWDPEVASQEPAGMGFLQLLALSRQVQIQSCFGCLHLDSSMFLSSADYRETALASADAHSAIAHGTVIIAEMQKPAMFYLHHELGWYRGYRDLELIINDELVMPIQIADLCAEAEANKNIFRIFSYKDNPLFLEIGNCGKIVGSRQDIVNWYGQMIQAWPSGGMASSSYIRFYYEVSQGTPLTPRYPDRTCLNVDDKHEQFMSFLHRCAKAMLLEYFTSFPQGARFTGSINAALLAHYFQQAPEEELMQVEMIPVVYDAFCGSGYRSETLVSLDTLKEPGHCFHEGGILVDDEYRLAMNLENLICYDVSEKAGNVLRKHGIPELLSVNTTGPVDKTINLTDLVLEFRYSDERIELVSLYNTLLLDSYDEPYIYAASESQVHDIVHQYLPELYEYECERSLEDVNDDLIEIIDAQLASSFKIIDTRYFNFIPRYDDLQSISFEHGNLAVAYRDGTSCNYRFNK